MGHYTKLGILVMRSFGLIILLYAVPIVIWSLARVATGASDAPDGSSGAGALFGWLAYAFAGLLLVKLARPLARLAARGLDEPTHLPPAA